MHTESHLNASQLFVGPTNPAALCFQIIRMKQPVTRTFLVEHLSHSQPTVTRAVSALMKHGLIQEQAIKIKPRGPGRPKIPLEVAPSAWVHAGIAIGTHSTYIGIYGIRGQLLRESFIEIHATERTVASFVAELAQQLTTMLTEQGLPLAHLGISTSGTVDHNNLISAKNLKWDRVDILTPFSRYFDVPLTLSSVVEAIAGAEQQHQLPPFVTTKERRGLVLYMDDSIGAATHTYNKVQCLTGNYSSIQETALSLIAQTNPHTVVLAGGAFHNAQEARALGRAIRTSRFSHVEIRVIPTHIDNARAAARAVALCQFLANPVSFATSMQQYSI